MKKWILWPILLLLLAPLTGCSAPYTFKQPAANIQAIHVVNVENDSDFTVLKTLSKQETVAFLQAFSSLSFGQILYGDPGSPHGKCAKIDYFDGSIEIIGAYWGKYIAKNGDVYTIQKYCSEQEFLSLLTYFLKTEQP